MRDAWASALARGANKTGYDGNGNTVLHEASTYGQEACLHLILLLPGHPDVNERNSAGLTALHLSAQRGLSAMVLALIGAGANHTIRTQNGFTPLHLAAEAGKLSVVLELLDAGGRERRARGR